MAFIRQWYNVPAKRGGLVSYEPEPTSDYGMGRIIRADGARLVVDFGTPGRRRVLLHPTYKIRYLDHEKLNSREVGAFDKQN